MCGINGIINFSGNGDESGCQKIRTMNQAISYRGPDDSGMFHSADYRVLLGHQRLAIQDLSPAGHQPMASSNNRYKIVFNGEIYNFMKLRAELESSVSLKSSSDTEVILELVSQFGIDAALEKMAGMFAFAIYDCEADEVILARDRIGEKPLYYGSLNGSFFFSSELKAIEAVYASDLTLNSDAVPEYLTYGYFPGQPTVYSEVSKLDPGAVLRLCCSSGEIRHSRFTGEYSYSRHGVKTAESYDELVNRFDVLLREVIDEQMISDVPLGCFLSGGIDSSLVSSVLAKISTGTIETFTVGFEDRQFDESEKAHDIADYIGANNNTILLREEDLLNNVEDTILHLDEPFANPSAIASNLLSEYARKKVTVCLSGDGGDELFIGYNRYAKADRLYAAAASMPSWLKPAVKNLVQCARAVPVDSIVRNIAQMSGRRLGVNYDAKLKKIGLISDYDKGADLYRALVSYSQSKPQGQNGRLFGAGASYDFEEDFIGAASSWDVNHYLPGDCLYKTDRTAMANSLEVRVPLLDRRIVEFAASIPLEYKLKGGIEKAILKDTLKKYLPEKLYLRPKMGFTVPLGKWINGPLSADIRQVLSREAIEAAGALQYEAVSAVMKKAFAKDASYYNELWSMYVFQKWIINRLNSSDANTDFSLTGAQ